MSPVSRALAVHRCPGTLSADATRVLARFFRPGGEDRIQSVIARVLSLTDAEVAAEMARVRREYESRHRHFEDVLFRHYSQIAPHIAGDTSLSNEKGIVPVSVEVWKRPTDLQPYADSASEATERPSTSRSLGIDR